MSVAAKDVLETAIIEALGKYRYCSLGTVEDHRPKVRYMALQHDGLRIYLASNKRTHKVEELRVNPNAYLLLGYEGQWPTDLIEIDGSCTMSDDKELRHRVWRDDLKHWFSGPDDPELVVLSIQPRRIEYTPAGGQRHVWESDTIVRP